MPFERYLSQHSAQHGAHSAQHGAHSAQHGAHSAQLSATDVDLGIDASTFNSNVHFQVPNLGAPTLAPGGGAEVLPAGFLANPNALAASWFSSDSLSSPAFPPQKYTQHSYHPPYRLPSYNDLHAQLAHPSPANLASYPSASTHSLPPISSVPLSIPSSLGLPVYSTSGFDLLSILSRVASRPHPTIALGPVDMTCSFVVADLRRYDAPIVYASPSFFSLTGYDEHEVIGRNCRFLQSPDGHLARGEPRRYTAPDAVLHLKRATAQDKECQTSIINYRKGGAAFINLVTVIPIRGGVHNTPEEADDIVYHVGFQVDLSQQPNAILQKLRDGTYRVDYSRSLALSNPTAPPPRNWRATAAAMHGVSSALHSLLASPAFVRSLPLSLATVNQPGPATGDKAGTGDPYDGNRPLNLLLLESAPDFVHVVSLKGAFLYVAPAVRRVLGYAPEELVGRSIAEFCHPADVVPLMRELKESSAGAGTPGTESLTTATGPRHVDLLFRMPHKSGTVVWVECRGRLHVEPGKGRKAIILSGRVRPMPRLAWGPVDRAGGLLAPVRAEDDDDDSAADERVEVEREVWALLSAQGTVLFAGTGVRDVLGWAASEVIGRAVGDLVGGAAPADARRTLEDALAQLGAADALEDIARVSCEMKRKDGGQVVVQVVLYRAAADRHCESGAAWSAVPPLSGPLVCQIKLVDFEPLAVPHTGRIVHPLAESVYDELQTTRGSSWQYELQQLKFANQRMMEEVATLEAAVQMKTSMSTTCQPQPQRAPPPPEPVLMPPPYEHELQYPGASRAGGLLEHDQQEWRSQGNLRFHDFRPLAHCTNQLSLKRPWGESGQTDPT